jgi:5'-3' exonuclease|tara:strand:- start:5263 stop:6264 length:1002 start_codon:yes stop_codon:yes gene_type:complete
MATFILVDSLNMFHRAKHVGHRGADIDTKIGMAFHIMMSSVKMCYNMFDADHAVFCLEGRSWRKDFYTPYKAQRRAAQMAKSEREQEEDSIMFGAYDSLVTFVEDRTNCTVLQNKEAEADDMIALFVASHPNDHHIIVSSDSDYQQLICDNVTLYDGVQNRIITPDGFFKDDKNRTPIKDKKTKEVLPAPDPEWLLFEKCVRGDTSDNIFSAYPGCRKKGTKNKVGMMEAFEDRNTGGFNWNNFMLQRWTDHNGEEHTVRDMYERNKKLIDLTAQPDDLKYKFIETIAERSIPKKKHGVGVNFLRFCGEWDLQNLAKAPDEMAAILNKGYPHG